MDMRHREQSLGCIWYVIAGVAILAIVVYNALGWLMSSGAMS